MLSRYAKFCLSLLKDTDPVIRKDAAYIIGDLGESECLLRLRSRLHQEAEAYVKKAIRVAIAKLS